MQSKSAKKRIHKAAGVVLAVVFGAVFLLLVIAGALFFDELKTLSSLEKKTDGVYTMTYYGDYGFDDFLEQGAENDSDIEEFVTRRLLKGLPIDINITDAGCTCFVSKNGDGDVIFCRNFDFEYAPMLQVHTKPDDGYASVSTVNLSFAGYDKDNLPTSGIGLDNFLALAAPFLPFDGMNEKGVCVALLAVPEADAGNEEGRVTLNTTTAIRLVLDKAADINEAVELLSRYNIYFSGGVECHFLIADKSGASVLVEYFDGGMKTVKPDGGYQIASNFIAYNGVNIGEGFNEFERYDEVKKLLDEKNNSVTMADCEALLNKIGITADGVDKLQWSAVYNLTDKTGRIWPYRTPSLAWDFEVKGK